MMHFAFTPSVQRLGIKPQALAAWLSALIGLSGLLGWILDSPLLKSVFPGAVEMKVNTALGLLFSAIALHLLAHPSPTRQRGAQVLGVVVLALGLTTLGEYLFGWQLGIDELLFRDTANAYNAFRGRMSPYSALVFACIGLALACLPRPALRPLKQTASIIVLLIGGVSLLGYLWNASELVTDRWLPPVAVNTALAFMLLGGGLLGLNRGGTTRRLIGSTVELKVFAGFAGTVLLLLGIGAYIYQTMMAYTNSAAWVGHTQQVRAALGQLYGDVHAAESRQRNYLLTSDTTLKDEYRRVLATVAAEQREIARLVADNPTQTERLAELEMLLTQRSELLSRHILTFEQHGLATAMAAIQRENGASLMQAIRRLITRMDQAEAALLADREATFQRHQGRVLMVLLAALAIISGILAALFLEIRREIIARALTEQDLRASEENLSITLNAIGDGVLVTDAAGRVTRLNPIAERLTGWTSDAAKEQPVAEVFHIVNAKTRAPATIPVADVLAQGVIHGLANDTLLIARDGHEYAIADSCAPIRDHRGAIIGTVLVFRDVTEEYAVQSALRASEERYRTLFESMDEGFCVVKMIYSATGGAPVDYRILETNPAFNAQTGLPLSLGKTVRELLPNPEERWLAIFGDIAHDGKPRRFTDHVASLQRHYDVFAFRIGEATEQRVGFLLRDITASKQAERQLVAAKEQAELANRTKDSFLATMSHEIRTPLSGMLGMLEVLSLTSLDEEQRELLRAASESSKSLLRIVNDILDWAKIEAGKMALSPQVTEIRQLSQEVVNTYARLASAKGLILAQSVDPRISPAHLVDGLRLSQVLNNFVSNAIKFTSNGMVTLRAELVDRRGNDEHIRFSVEDTGIGITEEQQQRLFQQYQQGSVDTSRLYGGTGLGLTICKRIAELMGGQIGLVSKSGQGSTFSITLTLPITDLPETASSRADERQTTASLFDNERGAPRLLAVDDHPINRDLLARQLQLIGLRVDVAADGRAALARWREGDYALLITDCHMPDMDGYALTRAIREIEAAERRSRIPIIAWTANALAEEANRCRDAGMDDVLIKPVNMSQLRHTLARWLGNAHDVPIAVKPTDAAAPIDMAELRQIVPEKADQLRMLREFQAHLRADHDRLTDLLTQDRPDEVRRLAHRMKGASGAVGAKPLATACATLEQAAANQDAAAMAAAATALADALRALDSHLDTLGVNKPAAPLASLHLLVVEDDDFQRRIIVNMLRALPVASIRETGNGQQALRVIHDVGAQPVDILICDLDMPEMDGLELLRHLAEGHHETAIILVSALGGKLLAAAGKMAKTHGIRLLGVIEKPLRPGQIEPLLEKYTLAEKRQRHILVDMPRFTLEEIAAGLRQRQIEPFFQPKVDLRTGQLVGAEALARWRHPVHGVVGPQAFIPVLEQHRGIDELTFLMLEKSAMACRSLHDRGYPYSIAVNLSLTSLDDTKLADRIIEVVQNAGTEPKYLQLEITETAAMTEVAHALENLTRLCMKGFVLSIDDYGTGYSSMQQLTRVAFGELKIDQSFIQEIDESETMRITVASSIEMAHKLGVKCLAEGVETRQAWSLLKAMGCDLAQGYFIAKPMDFDALIAFCASYRRLTS
jgi:PAS domain S-box-containing protein